MSKRFYWRMDTSEGRHRKISVCIDRPGFSVTPSTCNKIQLYKQTHMITTRLKNTEHASE
jgi:hypothetical protein